MTSLLSGISGQFGKALVLGTFLPVTVFVILLRLLVQPLYPVDAPIREALRGLDTEWEILAITFLAVVVSGLLFVLNIPIIRVFEGYPWQYSGLGRLLVRGHRKRLKEDLDRRRVLSHLEHVLRDTTVPELNAQHDAVAKRLGQIAQKIDVEFPRDPSYVLPTRLGNAVRSFEGYSTHQYRMDSITLWPRLVAKIDGAYASAIADAKTSFDFMLNSVVLSMGLAIATLIGGLIYPRRVDAQTLLGTAGPWFWFVQLAVILLFAWLLYRASISRAVAWGATIKSAFDLYRWDLLDQLGYNQKPASREDERALWTAISRQITHGDLPGYPISSYVEAPSPAPPRAKSRLVGTPATSVALETTRGVEWPLTPDVVTVVVRVRNVAGPGRSVERIEVTDSVPDGFDYVWDSAGVRGRRVRAVGTNPYRFAISGALDDLDDLLLTYRLVPRPAP